MGDNSAWFDGEALSGLATAAEVAELRALVAAMPPDPDMERVVAEQVSEWMERCVKRRREAALQQQDLVCLRDMYRAAEEVRGRIPSHSGPTRPLGRQWAGRCVHSALTRGARPRS